MPGARCAVALCNNNLNTTKKNPEKCHIVYHVFPKDDIDRRAIWINKCRRKDSFNPYTSVICSSHFCDEDYERNFKAELMSSQSKRKAYKLKKTAIPTQNLGNEASGCDTSKNERKSRARKREMRKIAKDVLNSELSNDIINEPALEPTIEPMVKSNEKLTKHQKSCNCDSSEKQKKLIKIWQTRYSNMKKQYMKKTKGMNDMKNAINILKVSNKQLIKELKQLKTQKKMKQQLNLKCSEILSTVFTESQVKLLMGKKMVVWSTEDLTKAFTLRYFSKRAYLFVKNEFGIPLPGLSTLRKYASKINLGKGVLEDILKIMKSTGSSKPEIEKVAVLTFDEMKIKSQYEYDVKFDQIIGKHSQMQVGMVRGLFSKWKQPVYIDFDKKMTKKILFEIISKVYEAGYMIVATVCDMGGGNMGLWRELGINIHRTFFSHPSNPDRKVFCFSDAPHALKLIRNWLLDGGFVLDGGDVEIDRKPLEKLLNSQKSDIKMCPKLRKIHLECAGPQRQNVALAAELLSNTTSKALLYMNKGTKINNLENDVTIELAKFIEIVNNWFDVFNSYVESDSNPNKCGFGVNIKEQEDVINEMISKINNMQCKDKNGKVKSFLQIFQKGVITSCHSLKALYYDLKNNYSIKYLLTHRLNQDCLENFFSQVRTRGGLDDHPTPLNAIYRIRLIILGKNPGVFNNNSNTTDQSHGEYLASSIFSNNEKDNDVYLLNSILETAQVETDVDDFVSNDSLVADNLCPKITPTPLYSITNAANIQSINHIINSKKNITSTPIKSQECNSDFKKCEEYGLEYFGGWVAKKHYKAYPELDLVDKNKSDHEYQIPSWANFLSYGGLVIPSSSFMEKIKIYENIFQTLLPNMSLSNEENIVKYISSIIFEKETKYPCDIVKTFVKLRIFIRIKYLNSMKVTTPEANDGKRKKSKKMSKIVK